MKYSTSIFALAAAFAPSVLGHGFLASVDIDGKTFKGNNPDFFQSPGQQVDSAIRLVSQINPVKGTDNPAINCGFDAAPGKLIADANPGSVMAFNWSGGSSQHWPHKVGPVITYLASCGETTCDKFDSKDAKWFKIDQQGQKPDNPSEWASGEFFLGNKVDVKIPEGTPPGNYLVRHEIVALHVATTKGGAEFYPSCLQLKVGQGSGQSIQPSETVTFPGAYKDDDSGILVPTIFDPVKNYQFPGPAISNVVSGTGSPAAAAGTARRRDIVYKYIHDDEDQDEYDVDEEVDEEEDDEPEVHPRQISRVMAQYRAKRSFF